MFIDILENICSERGVAPTRVLVDLGISKSAYTNWKNGGDASNRTKRDIADYFGITVKQLMDGETEKAPFWILFTLNKEVLRMQTPVYLYYYPKW